MAIQTINLGTYANDGTGDDLRTAFEKVNANFTELNTLTITGGINLGTGASIFAGTVASPATGDNLSFKTLVGGPNIAITSNSNTITIAGADSIYNVVEDLTPQLGGDLDTNGYNITSTSELSILAVDPNTNNFNRISLNGISISGSNTAIPGTTTINSLEDNNLEILADQELIFGSVKNQIYFRSPSVFETSITSSGFYGPTYGIHNGDVIGNVTGNTTGTHTGTVNGSVIGTVSSLSNHTLSSLSNVSNITPTTGQSLVWSGTIWEPKTVSGPGGAAALDLGSFVAPNPVSQDFGTINNPADLSLDFGVFSDTEGSAFAIIAVNGEPIVLADSDLSTLNFEAGPGIQLTATDATNTVTISNTGFIQATFSTVAVDGQDDLIAETSTSTLTLVAGQGIDLTTNAATNSVTITSTVVPETGLSSRAVLTATTASINDGATDNVTITEGYKGYMLYKIQTSAAAWVRIYTDSASRTADASRLEGDDPATNSGVIVEVITTGAETILLAPGVVGFNNEATPNATISMAVTNKSGSTGTITVSLTAVQLEA